MTVPAWPNPGCFSTISEDRLVVLDEIHRTPELFQTLRGIIDRGRRRGKGKGRFLILRSASRSCRPWRRPSFTGRAPAPRSISWSSTATDGFGPSRSSVRCPRGSSAAFISPVRTSSRPAALSCMPVPTAGHFRKPWRPSASANWRGCSGNDNDPQP